MEVETAAVDIVDAFLTCALVARLAEVTPETVRAWERRRLLPAQRTASGIRLFRRQDVDAFLRERQEKRLR